MLWSSFFRSPIQLYMVNCVRVAEFFKVAEFKGNEIVSILVTLGIIISLPIFSHVYLGKNHLKLHKPVFEKAYGTLYLNVDPKIKCARYHQTIWCIKRIILATFTVFLGEYIAICFSAYICT